MRHRSCTSALVALLPGLSLALFLSALFSPLSPQVPDPPIEQGPEGVVRELYDLVSFPAGTIPDWDHLRSLFLPEAVVVLRTGPDRTSVFSLEGFVQDWLRFIDGSRVEETGFAERILRAHTTEMGDIAHVWVLYEAEIPGRGRPPQPGVDSFQLVRRDGRWRIASVLNELPGPHRPIPEVLGRGGEG